MARNGFAGMSMRRLADACDVKVSTLYYYFPSKQDLLRDVVRSRSYEDLMQDTNPVDAALPPRRRLVDLLHTIWLGIQAERPVWRLIIGESQRGDPDAIQMALELMSSLERALETWVAEGFPELTATAPSTLASVLLGQLFGFLVEDMVLPEAERTSGFEARAGAIAELVFP